MSVEALNKITNPGVAYQAACSSPFARKNGLAGKLFEGFEGTPTPSGTSGTDSSEGGYAHKLLAWG